jgi:LysM repeat protein
VVEVNIPGIRGAESPTPTTTPGCAKNPAWKLVYEVRFNDTVSSIAAAFGTDAFTLAQGNCLADANLIREGQRLLVPGDAFPVTPEIVCEPIEALQPLNNTREIPNEGRITFNWRGPRTPYTLLRVIQPSGAVWEETVELRQNQTVDTYEAFKEAGWHEWWVLPLNGGFQQACVEGGPFFFYKEEVAATPTPTLEPTPTLAARP